MRQGTKRLINVALFAVTFATALTVFAMDNASQDYTVVTPNKMKWTVGPNSLPKGTQVTVLEGDPSKQGPFTLRIKMPAKYRIPPHFHPIIEHVTVLLGTLYVGMGDKFNDKDKQVKQLPVGSFVAIQPQMHHFAFTRGPTIIQLHGIGPWGITYVNPQDDPRNAKK